MLPSVSMVASVRPSGELDADSRPALFEVEWE